MYVGVRLKVYSVYC